MHEHASPDGAYVLVVEDDSDLRFLHAEILEDAGLPVRGAADGLEALETIEAHGPPAVIVLDLRMPRMNGWDFAERLRARPEWRDVALVVVAAHYQIREEARLLGARAWLHKPVNIDDLARVVDRAYRDAVASKASRAPPAHLRTSSRPSSATRRTRSRCSGPTGRSPTRTSPPPAPSATSRRRSSSRRRCAR